MTIELTPEELREIYIALEVRADNLPDCERADRLYNLSDRLRAEYIKERSK